MGSPLDVLLLVPFQPLSAMFMDPPLRRSVGAHYAIHIGEALGELTEYLGQPLDNWNESAPVFSDGEPLPRCAHRSLSAIALATVLERAGLRWRVFDPGAVDLSWFRRELARIAHLEPAVVGICSTFVRNGPWLRLFIAIVRRLLPRAKVVVGGYYYATDTEDFLKQDADVLFVGEGEVRFPQLVRALCENRPLNDIPGLYIRRPDGRLDFTGSPAQLDLAKESRPDWQLASRIDPPVDLARDFFEMGVETQRGCVFKCEFCTYRTLAAPNLMAPDEAVERIMAAALLKRGGIGLADATATFPHERWTDILEKLVERGGAPHPVWAYARVSDIDDRKAELMRRANVRLLLIGQESGDQRVLNLMRKGTKVAQIAPAMRALARNDITVCMTMICGFPGEDEASAANTRDVLCTVNDDCRDNPVVLLYKINPFHMDDFAAIASRSDFRRDDLDPRFRYASRGFDIERSGHESIRTLIEVSKIPHAPASGFATGVEYLSIDLLTRHNRLEIFRWMKQIDRALAIFLEHRYFGVRPNRTELRDLRERILAPLPAQGRLAEARTRVRYRVRGRVIDKLREEWKRESQGPVGGLTSLIVAAKAFQDTGNLGDSAASYRAGTYAPAGVSHGESAEVVPLAAALITEAKLKARTAKLRIA